MRFYSFTNWMLRPIQQGIQPGHAAVELLLKYSSFSSDVRAHMVWDWAQNHKTFMCMNGGNSDGLRDLLKFFDDPRNPYPYATFHEDAQSLDGIMTCISIVLPEEIYEAAAIERAVAPHSLFKFSEEDDSWVLNVPTAVGDWVWYRYSVYERDLVLKLNEYSLAT